MAARVSLGDVGKGTPPDGRPEGVSDAVTTITDIGIALGAALTASTLVTPIVLTIDRAVTMTAAKTCSSVSAGLALGLKDIVQHPVRMVQSLPLWLVWGVYASTYTTANLFDVYVQRKKVSHQNASMGKLVLTTGANMGSSIVKDVVFVKIFGAVGEAAKIPKRVPATTYGLFMMRDTLTIAGGFTVPPLVSGVLQSSASIEPSAADKIAQLISPMGMQLICTPVHLLALDMYNVKHASVSQRLVNVWETAPQATLIRMFRFLGAYGLGGLTNKYMIQKGKDWTVTQVGSQ